VLQCSFRPAQDAARQGQAQSHLRCRHRRRAQARSTGAQQFPERLPTGARRATPRPRLPLPRRQLPVAQALRCSLRRPHHRSLLHGQQLAVDHSTPQCAASPRWSAQRSVRRPPAREAFRYGRARRGLFGLAGGGASSARRRVGALRIETAPSRAAQPGGTWDGTPAHGRDFDERSDGADDQLSLDYPAVRGFSAAKAARRRPQHRCLPRSPTFSGSR